LKGNNNKYGDWGLGIGDWGFGGGGPNPKPQTPTPKPKTPIFYKLFFFIILKK